MTKLNSSRAWALIPNENLEYLVQYLVLLSSISFLVILSESYLFLCINVF